MKNIIDSKNKLILTVIIGNTLEYMDFMMVISMSPIITYVFLPHQPSELSTFFMNLIVVSTYLFRPIGGIIFGNIGDKYGRQSTFSFTLLLMAVPSFIISILPTFNQIGYSATILLIVMRILQGCSLGGEVPGSITYMVEKFKHGNYFFYCAMLTCGSNIGIVLGGQLASLLSLYVSKQYMYTTGWRFLFLGGSILAIFGFYIRTFMSESEEFVKLKRTKLLTTAPILLLLNRYRPEIIGGILLCMVVSLTTSVFHVFLPQLLVNHYSFKLPAAINMSSLGAATMAVFSVIFAYLTKYICPIKIIIISVLGLIVLFATIIIFGGEIQQQVYSYRSYYELIIIIGILIAGVNGVFFGLLADLFPVNVRYSGISICYNLAYILGAGLTPFWASLLIINEKSYKYVIIICLIFLIFLVNFFRPKLANK